MKNFKELILELNNNGGVVWHFNVSDISMIRAIFDASYENKKPVILGASLGERKFIGIKTLVSIIKSLREEYGAQIYLNADHTHSVDEAREAIDAGFDSVIFDGSSLSFEENILKTKEVVDYAKQKNPNIVIEGELGYIGAHSEILSDFPKDVVLDPKNFTKPEEAYEFIEKTGVDLFSPAVGNIHGIIVRDGEVLNPHIDINLIKAIKEKTKKPLVLHGGSGIKENEFIEAVKAGINIIHISTELRAAWRKSILDSLLVLNQNEVAPYKILEPVYKEIKSIVEKYLNLV